MIRKSRSTVQSSLYAEPFSKGENGRRNNELKLVRPSRNLFCQPRNKSLNVLVPIFPKGILFYGCYKPILIFLQSAVVRQAIVSKTEARLMNLKVYFDISSELVYRDSSPFP